MKMKIELIVTDMDGTAIKYPNKPFYSSWDALAEIFPEEGKREWFRVRDIYLRKGNGFYQEWFNEQVRFLKGIPLSEVKGALFPIPYSNGFKEFFTSLNGIKKAILSAGVDIVAKEIADELGFDYAVFQNIEIKDGFFTGRGEPFNSGLDKSEQLRKLSEGARISLSKICYVGDTFSDVSCLELVGYPVAFEPKEGLEDYVKRKPIILINDFRELRGILC